MKKSNHIFFIQDEVTQIDVTNKIVRTRGQTFVYDRLVVALGMEPDLDAAPGLMKAAYSLYSQEDLLQVSAEEQVERVSLPRMTLFAS